MTYAELICKIREAVKGEYEEYKYYSELAKMAPDIRTNEILSNIAKDKKEHAHVLKEAYFKLTGRMPKEEVFIISNILDYKESLKQRISLEEKDSENYKKLYQITKIDWLRDIFFKITYDANECVSKLRLLINDEKAK